mgnify:CR=1 FL=1
MKVKQLIVFFMCSILAMSVVFAALDTPSQMLDGEFDGAEPSIFKKISNLFSKGQPLSFTTVDVDDSVCYANGESGGYIHTFDGGVNSAGGALFTSFPSASSSQAVRIYYCSEKDESTCADAFEDLWSLADSDTFDLSDFWISSLDDVYITYEGYDCYASLAEASYTCFDGVWRGEPGTSYSGIDGICASNECKEDEIVADTTDEDEIEGYLCEPVTEETTIGSSDRGDEEGSTSSSSSTSTSDTTDESTEDSTAITTWAVQEGECSEVTATTTVYDTEDECDSAIASGTATEFTGGEESFFQSNMVFLMAAGFLVLAIGAVLFLPKRKKVKKK